MWKQITHEQSWRFRFPFRAETNEMMTSREKDVEIRMPRIVIRSQKYL